MRFVPGPDLPTGGKIVGLDGIREAYETGRGTFRTRATARVENVTPRRKGIVVTELPYGVGPGAGQGEDRRPGPGQEAAGHHRRRRLTDREHRACAWSSRSRTASTPRRCSSSSTGSRRWRTRSASTTSRLVDGQPRTLGLQGAARGLRRPPARRRTPAQPATAAARPQERLHLVDGLLVAILDIDEVIAVIRTSDDTAAARERLMTVFDLSEIQANYILEMPLRRLTKFSRIELEAEQETLRATIAELTEILESDEPAARRRCPTSSAEVAKQFGTPRRTVLLESAGQRQPRTAVPLEVADDPCWVLLSSTGLLARTPDRRPAARPTGPRAKHDVRGRPRCAPPRAARSPPSPAPAGWSGSACSTCRRCRRPPARAAPVRRRAGLGVPRRSSRDEQVLALQRRCRRRLGRPRAGHRAGRGQAGRAGLPAEQGLVGGRVPQARRPGGRRGRAGRRGPATSSSSPRDAQLLRFDAAAVRPQGRAAGGMAGVRLAAGARAVLLRGGRPRPASSVVVTVVRLVGRAAGHRRRLGQGDAVLRVPGQGPRHRRRALPPVPARRGRADAGVGGRRRRPGPRPRPAWPSTCPTPPAGGTGRGPRPGSRSRRSAVRRRAEQASRLRWRSPRPGRRPAPGSPGPRRR